MRERLPASGARFARPSAWYLCLAVLCGFAWAFTAGSPPIVRQRLTRTPISVEPGAVVELPVPSPKRPATSWPAAVLSASATEEGTSLRVIAGGGVVTSLPLGQAARRLPLALPVDPPVVTLLLQANRRWTLEWLEVATVVGHSRGVINFAVVPAGEDGLNGWQGRRPYYVGLLVLVALVWLAATPVGLPASRAMRWVHAAVLCAAVLILLAALLSPLLSRSLVPGTTGTGFKVLIAPRTLFLLCLVVFALPLRERLRAVGAAVERRGAEVHRRAVIASGTGVVTLFMALIVAHAVAAAGGNESALVGFSRRYVAAAPMLAQRPDLRDTLAAREAGYDGQFYYFMAFDPFLTGFRDRPSAYRAFIDDPPYRYGRVAFSLVVSAVTLGRAEWFPSAMLGILVAAHAAAALFFGLWVVRYRRSGWWVAAYAINAGLIASLLFALPEALAAALLVAAVYCWDGRRTGPAVVLFAAALLVRETSAVILIVLIGWELVFPGRGLLSSSRSSGAQDVCATDASATDRWWRAAALASAVLPMVAWRAYMCWRFFPVDGLHGFWANPSDVTVPFAGIVGLWGKLPSAPLDRAALLFPVLVIAAWGLALATARRREPLAVAAAVYGLLALSLNYDKIWSHLPSGERATCEFWLLLALIAVRVPADAPRLRMAYKLLFAALGVYLLLFAPEAASVRAGLLL